MRPARPTVRRGIVLCLCGTMGLGSAVGCDSTTGAVGGGALGAALGAGLGYAITGDERGAIIGGVIGAGVGATAGYFIGREVEKQRATEHEREIAQERGRRRLAELEDENPQAAQQLREAAKRPATADQKPVRQFVEVDKNKYVLYDPATDTVGTDVYKASGQDAATLDRAADDGRLTRLDGYDLVVVGGT